MVRRIEALEQQVRELVRQQGQMPLKLYGARTKVYTVIDDIRGKQDISTLSGTTIDGILYDSGSTPSSVPTLDPDDTAEASLTTNNIGWGTRRSDGERVWVLLRADDGTNTHSDMTRSVPYGSSALSVDTVEVDATDGGRATVYLPRSVR